MDADTILTTAAFLVKDVILYLEHIHFLTLSNKNLHWQTTSMISELKDSNDQSFPKNETTSVTIYVCTVDSMGRSNELSAKPKKMSNISWTTFPQSNKFKKATDKACDTSLT